jgi:hypothetical protein
MLFDEGLRNEVLGLHQVDEATAATLLRHAKELSGPMDTTTANAIFARQLKELGCDWPTATRG